MIISKKITFFSIFFSLALTTFENSAFSQRKQPISNGLSLAKIIKRPSFGWPVDCKINENCWIYNYVDMGLDDGKGTDLTCNGRTYEGHKGTDIALINTKEIDKNIAVFAAANGTISKIRDGEPDRIASDSDMTLVKEQRKECGNAVLIDHGEGLKTIYCHLKKGSILVKKGQDIKSGDQIASVGLSGLTEFPHLHFGVLDDGKIIDPFTGASNDNQCSTKEHRLWNKNVKAQYEPLIINQFGFGDQVPTLESLDQGDLQPSLTLPLNAKNLVFWFNYYGAQKGDSIGIKILDPNLKIFAEQSITQHKDRARQFYYTGKKLKGKIIQPGVYSAVVSIERASKDGAIRKWEETATTTILLQ